jgi:hypothetical protein
MRFPLFARSFSTSGVQPATKSSWCGPHAQEYKSALRLLRHNPFKRHQPVIRKAISSLSLSTEYSGLEQAGLSTRWYAV